MGAGSGQNKCRRHPAPVEPQLGREAPPTLACPPDVLPPTVIWSIRWPPMLAAVLLPLPHLHRRAQATHPIPVGLHVIASKSTDTAYTMCTCCLPAWQQQLSPTIHHLWWNNQVSGKRMWSASTSLASLHTLWICSWRAAACKQSAKDFIVVYAAVQLLIPAHSATSLLPALPLSDRRHLTWASVRLLAGCSGWMRAFR